MKKIRLETGSSSSYYAAKRSVTEDELITESS